jgi:hypothetical protein
MTMAQVLELLTTQGPHITFDYDHFWHNKQKYQKNWK